MRWLERILAAVGTLCVATVTVATLDARFYRQQQVAAFVDHAAVQTPSAGVKPIDDGAPIGLLEIPRLGLSTPVLHGDDAGTLRRAAGHLPDTPRPWELGNSAVAGHRDGVFRPLRGIKVGDEVLMKTAQGVLVYEVKETKVVAPDDLSVLAPGRGSSLTLITCYPFRYIGPAPKRFIVRAERVTPAR